MSRDNILKNICHLQLDWRSSANVLMMMCGKCQIPSQAGNDKNYTKNLLACLLFVFTLAIFPAHALETTNQQMVYEGVLLKPDETANTGNFSFRFSLWNNADFESSDILPAGTIDITRPDYLSWQELHPVTIGSDGKFSFTLGSITAFPATVFDNKDLFIQVEVKAAADPDTAYEVVDINTDNTIDRVQFNSVPSAFNADKIDFRDVGYGNGQIPYLDDTTSTLPTSVLPAASDDLTFTLNKNNTAGDISLIFGDSLAESLKWNDALDRFEFSDSVYIDGDLVVSGNFVPSPTNITEVLSPQYPNAVFLADGTLNQGSMYQGVETIASEEKNILVWESQQTALQDYDIVVRFPVPTLFTGLQTPALSLAYETEGLVTDAKIDLTVEKEGTVGDQIVGSAGLNLSSNTFTNTDFTLNSVWSAGEVMMIRLKVSSKDGNKVKLGDIKIHVVSGT